MLSRNARVLIRLVRDARRCRAAGNHEAAGCYYRAAWTLALQVGGRPFKETTMKWTDSLDVRALMRLNVG